MGRHKMASKELKPNRIDEIEGKRLVVVDRFLESSDVTLIQKLVNEGDYVQMGSIKKKGYPETAHSSVTIDANKLKDAKLLKKIKKLISQNYNCDVQGIIRAYVTQSKFGENSLIHKDSLPNKKRRMDRQNKAITAVIFVNDIWKEEWGGELTFFNESQDAMYCVSPKPGRIVLAQSEIWHRAGIPTRLFYDYRMTLVIMMDVDKVKISSHRKAA